MQQGLLRAEAQNKGPAQGQGSKMKSKFSKGLLRASAVQGVAKRITKESSATNVKDGVKGPRSPNPIGGA